EPELLDLVRLELAEFFTGTFLDGAPIVTVSAKTGMGLVDLRDALVDCAQTAPARNADGPFRLAIDRSFTLRGFGTIVTGTLASGRLRVEDEVEVLPARRRLRVRNLQVHGSSVAEATAGQRTAVNLAAVEASELNRGMMLVPPGLFRASTAVECRFELLSSAMQLKHGAPIHFHSGTAETEAGVRLLESLDPVVPGGTALLRLLLKSPLPLLPGDHFIVRMFSPVVTIGGGVVVENTPSLRLRRAAAAQRLRALDGANLRRRVELYAAETEDGITLSEAVARTGVLPAELMAAAEGAGLVVLRGTELVLVPNARIDEAAGKLARQIAEFHRRNPLAPGMPRTQAELAAPLLDAVLAASPDITAEGELLRLGSFRVQLQSDEDEALRKIESMFREGGLAAPGEAEVLANSGLEQQRARSILQMLLKQGKLVRVSPELIYHPEAIARLKQLLETHRGQPFSVPEFKDWTGISRKYAIPLLEFLDRMRLTRRVGDRRVAL
ncbi:MAG: SelB C-terminal domain-containing protein, partial [Bryobacteraceae bacterium]